MARPSVIPELREKLEAYLENRERDWLGQVEGERRPTLPVTSDGKVNVRQLAADAGLLPSQAQHLFNKPELAGPVNAVALAQGVKPIGSRALQDIEDEGVRKQVAKVGRDNSELRRTASEREALIDTLRRENGRLRAQLGMLEETGMTLRTGCAS